MLEICIIGLEFESGRAPFVRVRDSWSFTRSHGPTKYTFQKVKFPRNKNKKEKESEALSLCLFVSTPNLCGLRDVIHEKHIIHIFP